MDIRINVVGQKLVVSSNYIKLIGGSNKFIKFIFALDSSWDNLLPYAQFTQDDTSYNVYLDDKNSVFLPPEIKDGVCTLTLGGSGNGVIATTDYVKFNITGSILSEGQESTDITESMYEQLVDKVNSVRDGQSGLSDLVATERNERIAADSDIRQSIENNISSIEDDISTIQISIDTINGYNTALSQRITSEELTRATADASIQSQINEYRSSVNQTISNYRTETDTSISNLRDSITGVRASINNDIEDVRDDISDAVSVLNSRMDLALQQINKHEIQTILFEDESDPLAYINDKATLSDDPTTFDYIDFYYKTHVNSSGQGNWDKVFRFEPNSSQPTIVSVQPSDASATNKTLYVHELSFSISGLSITVVRSRRWYWNGNSNAAANLQQSDEAAGTAPDNMYGGRVYKIIGVNISDIDELTDLRIGADGTVYQSAGTAVRTQFANITGVYKLSVPGSSAVLSGNLTSGDFAKAYSAFTAGKGVYAVKDGEVYQLVDASSSLMSYCNIYIGAMKAIKKIVTYPNDTFEMSVNFISGSFISYDNTSSGLSATTVQEAIDKLNEYLGDLSELETTAKTDLVSAINEAAESGGSEFELAPVVDANGNMTFINAGITNGNEVSY